jgi:hypothetical protein
LNYILFSWSVFHNSGKCICNNKSRLTIQFYTFFILITIFITFILHNFNIMRYSSNAFLQLVNVLIILQFIVFIWTLFTIGKMMKMKGNCDQTKCTFNYNDTYLSFAFALLLIFYSFHGCF